MGKDRYRRITYDISANGYWWVHGLKIWAPNDNIPIGMRYCNIKHTLTMRAALKIINRYPEIEFMMDRIYWHHGQRKARGFWFTVEPKDK